jgi:hypothetical protein
MSFLFPDPPTPPNPYATAAAQTGTNVSTGVANAYLNNVNQVTPDGTLTYSATGSHDWTDPSTGQTYTIPTFTSTQELSGMGKAIKEQSDSSKYWLARTGNEQTQKISGMLNTPFNPNFNAQAYLQQNPDVASFARSQGMDPMQYAQSHYQALGQAEGRSGGSPGGGNASNLAQVPGAQTSFEGGGPIQKDFGFDAQTYLSQNPDVAAAARASGQDPATFARQHYNQYGIGENRQGSSTIGDITKSYGPADDFSSDRSRVESALMERMNPQLAKERGNIEQRLADQGIQYGSQAYKSAMDDYNRQATDTRLGITQTAGQEQQRMMDMAAQRAGFQNSAQQQAYDQALGRGTFANAAQGQQFQQNAAQGAFYNAGQAQNLAQQQSIFNAQNSQRNQYMQEQYQQRNQPMNEIAALASGSQIQQPNWLNSPTSQIANTDFAGIMNQNFQNQMGIYNTQSQNTSQLLGGLMGMGAGALRNPALSDRREKENIDPVGTVFAYNEDAERKQLPIYEYEYKRSSGADDGRRHVGPMAQDVERLDSKAVKTIGGRKHIDTSRVMGNILRAA